MLEKLSTVIETISIEEITHYFICDEKINYLTDIHNYDFKNILSLNCIFCCNSEV